MAKIVLVKHNWSSVVYAFYTDLELKKGDLVVCDTHRGYETAKVIRFKYEHEVFVTTKWIVAKVDTKSHLERAEKENRISYLKQQIDDKRKGYTEEYINELISQNDETMQSLLKELYELTNKNNNEEIELKDSFYFNNVAGGKFIAFKHSKGYIVKSAFFPFDTHHFPIDVVKGYIDRGYWKLID